MDGLRCIGDGQYNTIGLEVFCSLRQYSVTRSTLQLPFKPSNPSRLSTNSYPATANHPNPSCGNYPFQPIKNYRFQASHHRLQTLSIPVPSTTPSPTNPFHYLSSHVHSTLLLNGPFIFRFDFSLFLLYKRTQNIPKAMSQYQ